MPCIWMKPQTISRNIFLKEPSILVLILKTHFELIGVLFDGSVVNSHILFYFKELSSPLIGICHCLTSTHLKTSCIVVRAYILRWTNLP